MVDETEPQVGASETIRRARGGRKGKAVPAQTDNEATDEVEAEPIDEGVYEDSDSDSDTDSKQYNFRGLAKLLEPVPKLTSRNYYSWNAHILSFLQSVPHAMKHLEGIHNKKHLKEYHTFHQVWEKIQNGLTNESTAVSHQLALIAQLGDIKMFNSDAGKLIQEIRLIWTESGLLGKPFADDILFSALQKCMICHPVYKETVTTIHQISFDALAIALSNRQSTVENTPAQKVDPRQANARATGSNDREEPTSEDEPNDDTKTGSRSRRIQCWICKRTGHGIRQCNASVTIPENSPLAQSK
ncbi:uncharacterized protein UBRO_20519 [Ustilago bromivora]|uniref:CCHC-type domain-containing protein n=1 Tax=Ustilago bromivora TaxID=307758 RepID=A0A1K0GKQ4_9BASI|nr:uncharacterized protein UBRO_20519 [Ustilago bromivora]